MNQKIGNIDTFVDFINFSFINRKEMHFISYTLFFSCKMLNISQPFTETWPYLWTNGCWIDCSREIFFGQ